MSQAVTKNINLQDLLEEAIRETKEMMERGIDISDPSIITPLESTANQYSELAQECNQFLMELVKQQMNLIGEHSSKEIINEF